MIAQFSEGDWVFYNNPGHQFHMTMFQLQKIVPHQYDPVTGVTVQEQEYQLVYGARSVFAYSDQILHRKDPQIQQNILSAPYDPKNQINLSGKDIYKEIADSIFVKTTTPEELDRRFGFSNPIVDPGPPPSLHEGHEVVTNHAGGNSFKYCRKCKVEVFE